MSALGDRDNLIIDLVATKTLVAEWVVLLAQDN